MFVIPRSTRSPRGSAAQPSTRWGRAGSRTAYGQTPLIRSKRRRECAASRFTGLPSQGNFNLETPMAKKSPRGGRFCLVHPLRLRRASRWLPVASSRRFGEERAFDAIPVAGPCPKGKPRPAPSFHLHRSLPQMPLWEAASFARDPFLGESPGGFQKPRFRLTEGLLLVSGGNP